MGIWYLDTCTHELKSLIKGATAPETNPETTKMRNDLDKTVDSVREESNGGLLLLHEWNKSQITANNGIKHSER